MILLNNEPIIPTIFPDKTSQVWKLPLKDHNEIVWAFESESEIMHLAQLRALAGRCPLYIPYLPYGRQDKPISNDATFALRVFAQMLNDMDFSSILILDPHSDVISEYIQNCKPIYPRQHVIDAMLRTTAECAVYPDKGALYKYSTIYEIPYIYAEKTRDQATGALSGCKVHYGNKLPNTVLIVDDICDGGGTFIQLAKQLEEDGVKNVHLFVTHGLFTKGINVLFAAGIKRVFTARGEEFETHY